jgi:hypothetical protein
MPDLYKHVFVFVSVEADDEEAEETVVNLVNEAEKTGLTLWYAGTSSAGMTEAEIARHNG